MQSQENVEHKEPTQTHHEEEGEVHVVAVDSGGSAEAAFKWATRALPKKDRFIILHGLHELPLIDVTTIRRDLHNAEVLEAHRQVTEKFQRLCKDSKRECSFATATFMSGGELGTKICNIAETNRASTVICGSEGKGALGRVFLGTTSGSVLAKCKCSVLVVKAGEKYQKESSLI